MHNDENGNAPSGHGQGGEGDTLVFGANLDAHISGIHAARVRKDPELGVRFYQ